MKVEITWTETVVETFRAVMDYDEFAALVKDADEEVPTLEEIRAPGADNGPLAELLGEIYGGWDCAVAGLNDRPPDSSMVENRDVDSIKAIEDA